MRKAGYEDPPIDRGTVARIAQKSTQRTHAEVIGWTVTRISSGGGEAAGIYKISGTASDSGTVLPWSLILKILQPAAEPVQSSRWNSAEREALAYRSGLLDGLGSGLGAPECLEIGIDEDEATWLWLEDVGDETEGPWTISRYGLAAYHLGRFNGSYSATGVVPTHPWLSRNWLRGWIEEAAPYINVLDSNRDHPLVRQMYDVDHVLGLWKDRDRRLGYLENLPQTLCHLDAYRGNLFSRRNGQGIEQTLAIDWAFVGFAALGEELASLVAATVAMGHVKPQDMKALEATVIEGYLDGLNDEGCRFAPADVYDANATASSIRLPVGALRLVLPVLLSPEDYSHVLEQHGGTPLEELVQRWGDMNRHLKGLG